MGQRVSSPLPRSMLPRAMMPNGRSVNVRQWTQPGGQCLHGVRAPDKVESGGFTKKLANCACAAVLVNVATNVPMPMRRARTAPRQASPADSLSNRHVETSLIRATALTTITQRSRREERSCDNDGRCSRGDIINCSKVPASRSFTIAAAETMEAFKMHNIPNTPVTTNQEATSPGLNRNAGNSRT